MSRKNKRPLTSNESSKCYFYILWPNPSILGLFVNDRSSLINSLSETRSSRLGDILWIASANPMHLL